MKTPNIIKPKSFSLERISTFLSIVFVILLSLSSTTAQKLEGFERDRIKGMLKTVKSEIKKNYYDASFGGKDLDAMFKGAEEQIDRAATVNEAVGILAQTVIDFEDSHTIFLPPSRASKTEYGWQMQMFADKCFVTAVKPGSDAEAQGLKPGDEILKLNNFRPTRSDMPVMLYYYYTLSPRNGMQLIVKSPSDKEPKQLNIAASVKQLKRFVDFTSGMDIFTFMREAENEERLHEHRFIKAGDVTIWNMPTFAFDPSEVDGLVDRVKNGGSLVLDLRGNGGGYVDTLEKLVGYFFDRDVKIADLKGRKEMKPQQAKSKGGAAFKGKVVVLIDSRSASASEIFARLMQLEKRGVVIGDKSAGSVMQSRSYIQKDGVDSRVVFYGISITEADVIMSDGKSLEKVGVSPDELILPTGADLASSRDPVLARAVELAGGKINSADAGKFFPVRWRK